MFLAEKEHVFALYLLFGSSSRQIAHKWQATGRQKPS
jgi:hypothetical protein